MSAQAETYDATAASLADVVEKVLAALGSRAAPEKEAEPAAEAEVPAASV